MATSNNSWLLATYEPVTLFSLRTTLATSKGGKTLVVPTPYAVKMALIDSAFRAWSGSDAFQNAQRVFEIVKAREIRFRPPPHCVVQNTFVKALDAERDGDLPFKQTIVYREFVAFSGGPLEIAINIQHCSTDEVEIIERLFWHINSIGKRGSFWQCTGTGVVSAPLPDLYSASLAGGTLARPEKYGLIQMLDDFGDDLCRAKDGFDRISTYGSGTITLGKHRILTSSAVAYRLHSSAKRFTWYKRTG
jgi:hypothetical protein